MVSKKLGCLPADDDERIQRKRESGRKRAAKFYALHSEDIKKKARERARNRASEQKMTHFRSEESTSTSEPTTAPVPVPAPSLASDNELGIQPVSRPSTPVQTLTVDEYDPTCWDPGADSSIPPRPMSPNFNLQLRHTSTAPREPIYERLDIHARRAEALIRAWKRARDIDFRRDYYKIGKSGIDLIHLCNDFTILRSNCHYVTADLEDLINLASSPPQHPSYNQAYIRARRHWNGLFKAMDGFHALIEALAPMITHETQRWNEASAEIRAEWVELGLPLDPAVWGDQEAEDEDNEDVGKAFAREPPPESGGVQFPSVSFAAASTPYLPAGVKGKWAKGIECLGVRRPPPPLIDLTDT